MDYEKEIKELIEKTEAQEKKIRNEVKQSGLDSVIVLVDFYLNLVEKLQARGKNYYQDGNKGRAYGLYLSAYLLTESTAESYRNPNIQDELAWLDK